MISERLLAMYLGGLSLVGFFFVGIFANGIVRPQAIIHNLSQARVGLYHQADATRQLFTGEFIDENTELMGTTVLDRVLNALSAAQLSLHQKESCISQDYAKNCNLPIAELPLGIALALCLIGVIVALRLGMRHRQLLRRGVTIVGLSFALGLVVLALSFGASINASVGHNLQQARVGLYIEKPSLNDRGGRLTFDRPASARPKRSWGSRADPNTKTYIFREGSILLEVPSLVALGSGITLLLLVMGLQTPRLRKRGEPTLIPQQASSPSPIGK